MCKERYINPFTDFGFKKLFGCEDAKEFLISFLNALIGDSDLIEDISYSNPERLGLSPADRAAIFDLYCTTQSGAHVIVEMQNVKQRFFVDRSIYYSSYAVQEAANKGEWDFRLPKVYTIALLNFCMDAYLGSPSYKHVVRLADLETGREFSDRLTYIYLELPKFAKRDDELEDMVDKWMYVIKNMNQLDNYPVALRTKIFERFFRYAEIMAFTPQERQAYELSLKNMRDMDNCLRTAVEDATAKGLEQGIEQGIEMGVEKNKFETARRLKVLGVAAEVIASATGLTIHEIEGLE